MSPARRRSLTLAKYSGAGNDFLIIDERFEDSLPDAAAAAKALCRRGVSVGADGLVLLTFSDIDADGGADARIRLWNADGSSAEFSGNAARCAVRYLADEEGAASAFRLQTDIGVVTGAVDGRTTRVDLPGLAKAYPQQRIRVEGRDLIGTYVHVGVPFFVLLHDDPDDLPVRYLGRAIRNHAALQPAGANVDFARIDDEQSLYFRVYERGVESETLSSGTGSIAAALAAAIADRVVSPVACTARGGTLIVRFRALTPAEAQAATAVSDKEAEAAQNPDDDRPQTAAATGEPVLFGDITIEGDTRRLMTGVAFADALQLR